MKVPKFNFYSAIITALVVVFIAACTAMMMSSCEPLPWSLPLLPPDDPDYVAPPEPIVLVDTCTGYAPIDTPSFVQAYAEFDTAIPATGWIMIAGSHRDTIYAGEEHLFETKMKAVISAYEPQYSHFVNTNPQASRLSIITRGTDDHTAHQLKVWFITDYAKVYMGYRKRGLYTGGACSCEELIQYAHMFGSLIGFNTRDAFDCDSIRERKVCQAIVDTCKLAQPQSRADLRFNQWDPGDSLLQAFDDAGWDQVLTNLSPGDIVYSRGKAVGRVRNEYVIDMRGYRVHDHDIAAYLDKGYQVIADLD